jgi:phenylpropionate dioxygenase-like ring-hydroxylating dioxygenase large terminal subunit
MVDVLTAGTRPTYLLPPEAYYSATWFERERSRLFGHSWTLIGHVSNVPAPGDYLTAFVGAEPMIVVRGRDGRLRAYLNICRHRGMVVAQGDGTCATSLRCPYHGWEWTLNGELCRVPQRKSQFGDVDHSTLGLLPASVATWAGFVFAHPDPEPSIPFTDWLGDFPSHCGDYPWSDLIELDRHTYDMACNWKLFVENHIDWLHLWYLHETTIPAYDHNDGVYAHCGLHWYSAERLRAAEAAYVDPGLVAPPGLSDIERRTVRANLLFPSTPFITTGSTVMCFMLRPTGPETTELEIRVYAMPGSVSSEQTWGLLELIIIEEDAKACEQMQLAIHSERFSVGPLALEHERPIAEFHANLLASLEV